MVLIIIVVIVIVIVVVSVIRSVKESKRVREYQEHRKDLETRTAAGDETAKQELIEMGSSESCKISCAGGMPDDIVAFAGNKLKETIAQNGGPGENDWELTGDKDIKEKHSESWTLWYKSPQGDRITLVYVYYRGGSYEEEGTGRKGYGINSYIRASFTLKMLPDKVQSIGKQVEQTLRDYLFSKGETLIKSRF